MSDPRNVLKSKYADASRFNNFGPVITRIIVRGFRCHVNTDIDIRSPITAICGLNGTGKSTILQLLATARRAASAAERTFYLRDFFLLSNLDQAAIRADASAIFHFWQNDQRTKQLTISKSSRERRWSGYNRRPRGNVFFAPVGIYIPKIEQRDLVARYYSELVVTGSTAVEDRVREWSCRILSQAYGDITRTAVRHGERNAEILTVERSGSSYSELHMGFGEGRSQFLVNSLERMPNKSLVLIEEPETSLHPAAQFEFGRYLVDVSIEKGHQVFLTTHSESLLRALPEESLIYLQRTETDIEAIAGLSSSQAHSLMSQGRDKALTVLVEDNVARAILREIIRTIDPRFLACVYIGVGGDKDVIARTVKTLKKTGLKVAAVRDGDAPSVPADNIFKLPGTRPPEIELFDVPGIHEMIRHQYGVDLNSFRAGLGTDDHHEWLGRLATQCGIDQEVLVVECARVYTTTLAETDRSSLVVLLKAAAQ